MKSANDVRGTKAARHLLTKKGVDISLCDVRVMNGHCHIRGVVMVIKGFEDEIPNIKAFKTHMEQLARLLRQKEQIRDVNLEVTYKAPT